MKLQEEDHNSRPWERGRLVSTPSSTKRCQVLPSAVSAKILKAQHEAQRNAGNMEKQRASPGMGDIINSQLMI